MPVKQIPLDGGLITQVEPEEVGISGCTELIDCEFDKPGLIYKRIGRGSLTAVRVSVKELTRWIAPSDTIYWIVFNGVGGHVYITTDLETLGGNIFTNNTTSINILNYGSMLRFANGTVYEPKLYQYIDRDFFWYDGSAGYNFTPAFNTDKSIPQAIDFTLNQCGALSTNYTATMGHSTKTYQYKLTFVYDGNQETELPKLSAVSSSMGIVSPVVDDDDVFYFD